MPSRPDLQILLEDLLESRNVYFQPPESLKLQYRAIVYKLSGIDIGHANDLPYRKKRRYTVTLIDPDPDSVYVEKLTSLRTCRFDTSYKSDNLNHFVFTLYF